MEFVIGFINKYGILSSLLLITLEYACFPLPSEIVLPFSGAMAVKNHNNFFALYFASIIASLIGSLICYSIGYFGGSALLNKITKKFPSSTDGINASQNKFNKYANLSVCIGRLIPLCRTYISLIAGVSKQSLISFLGFSAIGISIWNAILMWLGFKMGENWQNIIGYYDKFKMFLIPLIAISFIIYVVYLLSKKRKTIKE